MDVSFPSPVLDAADPSATVRADDTHDTEDADTEVELRVPHVVALVDRVGADITDMAPATRSRRRLEGSAAVVVVPGSAMTGEPVAAVLRYADAHASTEQ